MLGWDVGTFEFLSDRIEAQNYNHHPKLKLRTGGSVGKIPRTRSHADKQSSGYYFDLSDHRHKADVRLPVKYRYRSPVVFEFHVTGKRKADAYAVLWLQHLVDNEETQIDIPIWRTSSPQRLTQNYVTEENIRAMNGLDDLEEVGRLKFAGRFKAGMDESHEQFVSDNDSRETYETWEACLSEGVRQRVVEKELPERVQALHDQSLLEGRDTLKQADNDEKSKWLNKDGADWSGAFGEDPQAYMDSNGRKVREPGSQRPLHDPHDPSSDDDNGSTSDSASDDDLGIQENANLQSSRRMNGGGVADGRRSYETTRTTDTTDTAGTTDTYGTNSTYSGDSKRLNKRSEERKHRGLMQWKPARNLKFAKDEGKLGIRKLKNKLTGGLEGRKPGVETETGG